MPEDINQNQPSENPVEKATSFLPLILVAVMGIICIFTIVIGLALMSSLTGVGTGLLKNATNPETHEPIVPMQGACSNVQTVDQLVKNWCGVASAAQVIAFWQGNYSYYSSRAYMETWGGQIRMGKLNQDSRKSYQFTNDVNRAINSVNAGRPVIAYTALYGYRHIIVLTCYDPSTETFTANDSEPRGAGGQQSVQRIGGVTLTKDNLTGRYNGGNTGTGVYNHPEFLVTN